MTPAYITVVLETFKLKKDKNELYVELHYPTPANLKKSCAYICAERFDRKDGRILKQFFEEGDDKEKLQGIIETTDPEDFRAVQNYLNEETANPREKTVELAAWLIDFEPRPYKAAYDYESLLHRTLKAAAALATSLEHGDYFKKDFDAENKDNQVGSESGSKIPNFPNGEEETSQMPKRTTEVAPEVHIANESDNADSTSQDPVGTLEAIANDSGQFAGDENNPGIADEPGGRAEPENICLMGGRMGKSNSREGGMEDGEEHNGPHEDRTDNKDSRGNIWIKIKKPGMLLLIALLATCGIYLYQKEDKIPYGKVVFSNNTECMYWAGDHYEAIPCGKAVDDMMVVALDTVLLRRQKKLDPRNITVNDIRKVYYFKSKGKMEFYAAPGNHPIENRMRLKPLTDNIYEKYLKPLHQADTTKGVRNEKIGISVNENDLSISY